MATYDYIIALAIVFGLTIMFTLMTYKDFDSFMIWLTVFIAFMVWADLLELWTLIVCLLIFFVNVYIKIKNRGFMAI